MKNNFFERLAESLGTAVLTVQLPDRIVSYVNPSVETLLGYTKEECLGRNTEHFYPNTEEFIKFGDLIRKTIEQKKSVVSTEQLLKRKDGTVVLTEITVSFIWENGFVDQVISVVKDITERRLLEDQKEKLKSQFRNMIDSYPTWISCVDTDGNYFIANEYYSQTFHLPISQIEGHNFKEFFPPDLYEKHHKLLMRTIESGERVEWEDQHRFAEERITYIHGIYTPLYDQQGSIWGVSAFALDISKRKRVELEKEALIDKLQLALDEVKTLRGILPICSSCKKIRDDKGYWNQLEEYVAKHSHAEFSHGMCQECAFKLYPELVDKDGKVKGSKR